jgi:DNA topoisomerase II
LYPSGTFGSRSLGGKDAASARYIFTKLNPLTRLIFHPEDDDILEYDSKDEDQIEPSFYIPIIPMILVNGTEGVGTGWSTFIPSKIHPNGFILGFNPVDIIDNIIRLLNNEELKEMVMWSKGFKGKIRLEKGE